MKAEKSFASDKCYGCGTHLGVRRERFEWLISRGYDTKDAAAQVLHSPGGMLPINSCCVVGLETNLDPEKGIKERQAVKDALLRERVATALQTGAPNPNEREVVEIYPASMDGMTPGRFVIEDFANYPVELLAGSTDRNGVRTLGFPITNIAYISKELATSSKYGWKNIPLALLSGKIKIIPAVVENDRLESGVMWMRIQGETGPGNRLTDVIDKTLLGAEIISYRKIPMVGALTTTEWEMITLRKKLPKDLVG